MGCRWCISALVLVAMLFIPVTASAGPDILVGVGIHSASFGKDLRPGKYVDIHPGPGAVVVLGVKFNPILELDIKAGRTVQKEDISASRVNTDWLEIGPVIYFIRDGDFRPFISAGAGSYKIKTTGLDPEGAGYYAGAGFEQVISRHHSAKLYLEESLWEDEDLDLEVSGFHVGLVYNYNF